ncbi:MAG: hypothetical protein ACMUHU_03830 [Thermoplasmatota archaeon]
MGGQKADNEFHIDEDILSEFIRKGIEVEKEEKKKDDEFFKGLRQPDETIYKGKRIRSIETEKIEPVNFMIRVMVWSVFVMPIMLAPMIIFKTYEWKFGMELTEFLVIFSIGGFFVLIFFLLLYSTGERRTYVLLEGGIMVIHAWSRGGYGSSSLSRVSFMLSDIRSVKRVKKILYLHLFNKEFRGTDSSVSSRYAYDQYLITLRRDHIVLPLFDREDFKLNYKNAGMTPKGANSYLLKKRFTVPKRIFDDIMRKHLMETEED